MPTGSCEADPKAEGQFETAWVITIERNWFGTREPSDGRAFWCRSDLGMKQTLERIAKDAGVSLFWDSWSSESRQAVEDALEKAALRDGKGSRVALERRRVDEGFDLLWVIRLLGPDADHLSQSAKRLMSFLELDDANSLELPCSGTEASFVGSSSMLWRQAIDAQRQKEQLHLGVFGQGCQTTADEAPPRAGKGL